MARGIILVVVVDIVANIWSRHLLLLLLLHLIKSELLARKSLHSCSSAREASSSSLRFVELDMEKRVQWRIRRFTMNCARIKR